MDQLTKKAFFKQLTPGELKERNVKSGSTADGIWRTAMNISQLDPKKESYRITAGLFPNNVTDELIPSRWWRKHLPVHIIDETADHTLERVANAYNHSGRYRLAGYGYPAGGEVVVFSLDDTMKGAKLFKYEVANMSVAWERNGPEFGIRLFDSYAEEEGAIMNTTISSTRPKEHRVDVSFEGLGKLAVPTGFCCPGRKYRAQKFGEKRNLVDKHHVAGLYKLAGVAALETGAELTQHMNLLVPSQRIVDFAYQMEHSFVREERRGHMIDRPVYGHEREALLTAYAKSIGFAKAFGGKSLDLNWHTQY